MNKIHIDTWSRKETYQFYREVDLPTYLMTFQLDVTRLYHYIKKEGLSFYLSMIHTSLEVMNSIENFKYRFINSEPYLMDSIHPSFTDQIDGSDQFKIVTIDFDDDLKTFNRLAKEKSKLQGSTFIDLKEEQRVDLVYITSFPWASYTQVSHAKHLDKYDAIPRVCWGKFEDIQGKKIMPFSIEVHHAFVDGLHVGKLITKLQEKLNQFE